jgi:hypothetical protein
MSKIKASVFASIRAAILANANAAGEIGAALLYSKALINGQKVDAEDFRGALRQMAEDKEINVAGQVVRFTEKGRKVAEGPKDKGKTADAQASKRETARTGKKTTGGGKAQDAGPKSGGKKADETGPKDKKADGPAWVSMDKLSDAELMERINAPESFTAELVARALGRLRGHARTRGLLEKGEK